MNKTTNRFRTLRRHTRTQLTHREELPPSCREREYLVYSWR